MGLFVSFFFSLALLESLVFFSPRGLSLEALLAGGLQALFEAYLFAWVSQKIKSRLGATLFLTGVLTVFFVQAAHVFLVRTLDTSIDYLLQYFFSSSFSHFVAAIEALHFPLETWFLFFGLFLLVPLGAFGLGLGRMWRPLSVKPLLPLWIAILTVDGWAAFSFPRKDHEKFVHSLLVPRTFFSPSAVKIPLEAPLRERRDESLAFSSLEKKPNLYFFIVESLRSDCVGEQEAPSLFQFGKRHCRFERSFSNANGTHLSWFTLLSGQYPHHWVSAKKEALGIQALKKLGYEVRVYTSSDLHYYGMLEKLFTKDVFLFDTSPLPLAPWAKDALLFEQLEKDLPKQGVAHFFFLESTHSEYSFPPTFSSRFSPIAPKINYLELGSGDGLAIKNRYRTAISYVDSLFDQFFHLLEERGLYEESLIAITGDHGEEFFDEGCLFHGTHLNTAQTAVPILLKLGPRERQTALATHVDVMPTLLHALTGEKELLPLFDGHSLLLPREKEVRVAVQQNGAKRPLEFLVEEEGKLPWRFRIAPDTPLSSIQEVELLEGEPLSLPF